MVLVTNAIAILSEDRFLARIGWSASSAAEPAFGNGVGGDTSVKSKLVNLIASVRTLMRSKWTPWRRRIPWAGCGCLRDGG
jgi:hypothetical protein